MDDDDDDADDDDDYGEEENLEIPKYGVWHRINPNWVDPPMARTTSPPYAGSLISTVPNSDGCSVAKLEEEDGGIQEAAGYYIPGQGDEDEERTDTDTEVDDTPSLRSSRFNSSLTRSKSSFISHMLKASVPLASLFATSREKVPHLRKAAHKQGLHVGLMRKPSHASRIGSRDDACPSHNAGVHREGSRGRRVSGGSIRSSSSKRARSPVCPDGSWWVVMGKDAAAVRHIEERALPLAAAAGFAGPEAKLRKRAELFPNAALAVGFLQLVLAGVFGGLIVVYGLSLL
jgi:hypothetical protein